MTADELWDQLHGFFDTDDGSLPDIHVENLSPQQIHKIYTFVRSKSEIYTHDDGPLLWDEKQEKDVPIKDIPDPVSLLNEGIVRNFSHGLTNFFVSGVELKELAIFVWPDSIDFDYRMGLDWGPEELAALFDFLWEIQQLAPEANISHQFDEYTKAFDGAWKAFVEGKTKQA